jgi:uncharacterized protein (DUF1330 family)
VIYLTQLVYVRDGCEDAFHQFEELVLPLLPKYGGELLLRLRPGPSSVIAGSWEPPYEVHILRFESDADVARYSNDEVRQRHLSLKDQSVRSALLIRGTI